MNKQEIYDGLWRITKEKQDACKAEAEAVDRDHPTERGALQLKAGIYHVAIAAGLISGVNRAADIMSKRFINLLGHFPDLAVYYHGLTDEEKGIMAVSLYPELFMRASFYNTYQTELANAEKYGDPQAIFKARIKKEVLDEILDMWRGFRVQNGLFTFAFDKEDEL